MGDNLAKIVISGINRCVRYSRHVRHLGCPLLGGFTVVFLLNISLIIITVRNGLQFEYKLRFSSILLYY